MIKFTQLVDKLEYPSDIRAALSTTHASIVTYAINNFSNRAAFKQKIVSIINTVSYYGIEGDSLPSDWDINTPLDNLDIIDQSVCEKRLGKLFLKFKNVSWDVEPVIPEKPKEKVEVVEDSKFKPIYNEPKVATNKESNNVQLTPKDHLYIKPPIIPQFDFNKPWLNKKVGTTLYTIYTSLPEVPIVQNQVSVSTDVNKMTARDLTKLYPNHYIKTRPAVMYEDCSTLTMDKKLGLLIPVNGFSQKQIRDNVVKYPHWFKLTRNVDGEIVNFYTHIEIDGKLENILEIWDSLPESKKIPKLPEFIKEYAVRRYLLERDIKHIKHKYPIHGTLGPYMVLFTTIEEYASMGYTDAVDMAKQCVISRVEYKQSRNPIIRICSS